MSGVKIYNQYSKCCLLALIQAHNPLATLIYCPIDDMLFEASADLLYFKLLLLLWKPHSWL